jgi:outer membrane murein-binding lipoprotein Lpp
MSTTLILIIAAVILGVLYLVRRNSRLKREAKKKL